MPRNPDAPVTMTTFMGHSLSSASDRAPPSIRVVSAYSAGPSRRIGAWLARALMDGLRQDVGGVDGAPAAPRGPHTGRDDGYPGYISHDSSLGGIMTTARDIMTGSAECARTTDTLVDAAKKMRDLDVGALPICGEDDRLKGMITDRDIVTGCVATGGDCSAVKVEEYTSEEAITIGADDSIEETLRTMTEHGVRRLPVIDGHDLIGIVSQADVAKNLDESQVGKLVEAISNAPSN